MCYLPGLREDLWLLKPLTPSSHHPGLPSCSPTPVSLPWLAAGAYMAQEISSVDGGGVGVELCFGFLLIWNRWKEEMKNI